MAKVTWKLVKYGNYWKVTRNGILMKRFTVKKDAMDYVKGARAERKRITALLRKGR